MEKHKSVEDKEIEFTRKPKDRKLKNKKYESDYKKPIFNSNEFIYDAF